MKDFMSIIGKEQSLKLSSCLQIVTTRSRFVVSILRMRSRLFRFASSVFSFSVSI
jgi:hypothetical protein